MKTKINFFSQLTILSVAFFIYSNVLAQTEWKSLMEKTCLDGRLRTELQNIILKTIPLWALPEPVRRILFYALKKCMVILF